VVSLDVLMVKGLRCGFHGCMLAVLLLEFDTVHRQECLCYLGRGACAVGVMANTYDYKGF